MGVFADSSGRFADLEGGSMRGAGHTDDDSWDAGDEKDQTDDPISGGRVGVGEIEQRLCGQLLLSHLPKRTNKPDPKPEINPFDPSHPQHRKKRWPCGRQTRATANDAGQSVQSRYGHKRLGNGHKQGGAVRACSGPFCQYPKCIRRPERHDAICNVGKV